MDETSARRDLKELLSLVRKALKTQGKTYRDVALALGVSEQTVKRFFSGEDVSLLRLLQLCQSLGVELAELASELGKAKPENVPLSEAQEEALAANPGLFALYLALRDQKSLARLAADHRLSLRTLRAATRELESLGLVERHPGDEVRVVREGSLSWIIGGPLQRRYLLDLETDWFRRTLTKIMNKEGLKKSLYANLGEGRVTAATRASFIARLEEVRNEFFAALHRDKSFAEKSDRIPVKWILALGENDGGEELFAEHLRSLS